MLDREHFSTATFCVVAALLDILTTYIIIEQLNGAEINPFMESIINHGWSWAIITKFTITIGFPIILKLVWKKTRLIMIWKLAGFLQLFAALFNAIGIIIALNHQNII